MTATVGSWATTGPGIGSRRVQRGTVAAVDPLGTIDVLLDDGTEHRDIPIPKARSAVSAAGAAAALPLYP